SEAPSFACGCYLDGRCEVCQQREKLTQPGSSSSMAAPARLQGTDHCHLQGHTLLCLQLKRAVENGHLPSWRFTLESHC
uniref:Uncharacterized protein n=1 Tax=Coturnix japonica TaxID=93934 RepID=A0A8C2SWD6_COTJA